MSLFSVSLCLDLCCSGSSRLSLLFSSLLFSFFVVLFFVFSLSLSVSCCLSLSLSLSRSFSSAASASLCLSLSAALVSSVVSLPPHLFMSVYVSVSLQPLFVLSGLLEALSSDWLERVAKVIVCGELCAWQELCHKELDKDEDLYALAKYQHQWAQGGLQPDEVLSLPLEAATAHMQWQQATFARFVAASGDIYRKCKMVRLEALTSSLGQTVMECRSIANGTTDGQPWNAGATTMAHARQAAARVKKSGIGKKLRDSFASLSKE